MSLLAVRRRQVGVGGRNRLWRETGVRDGRGAGPNLVAQSGRGWNVRERTRRETEVLAPETSRRVRANEREGFQRESIELTEVSRNVAEEQIIVDAIACAYHCFTAAARRVSQSNSRPEVVRIAINFARCWIEDIVHFWIRLKLISNAGIQCQRAID